MVLTRWKMMAGVLGVSLGGLAAFAGQCPKTDANKGPEVPPVASAPLKVLPAPPAPAVELPVLPASTPPVVPSTLPPPVIPASGTSSSPPTLPLPATPEPELPQALPTLPPPPLPVEPVAETPLTKIELVKPALTVPDGGTTSMEAKHAKLAANKYRIVLRVGEGDPTFEVRCGDDLIMKVVSEKVDIKSPEKGNGPTAVTASGKVRFAGFWIEGVCDQLTFLAGTGQVEMAGEVKIQVKDKLGRVESELSTQKMTYKIDPSAINGTMKP